MVKLSRLINGCSTGQIQGLSLQELDYDFKDGGEDLGPLQVQVFQELWNECNPQDQIRVDGRWGAATADRVRKSPAQGFGKLPVLRKGLFSEEVGELQLLLREALQLGAIEGLLSPSAIRLKALLYKLPSIVNLY